MSSILQDISFEENPRETFVDFVIRSDNLNPLDVSKDLGLQPTRAWAKHDMYEGRARNPTTDKIEQVWRKRPTGIWAIDSTALSKQDKVENHVLYLLNQLEPKQDQLSKYLSQEEIFIVRFYIWWEPVDGIGGYEITNTTLARMATLSHYVEFSFFGKFTAQ